MTETRSADAARSIRVFVSSTFQDMQGEREELLKLVFPRLRILCESRGVSWGEVDLRWGITDEQRAEGNVLPICFEEIEHCRPFFIGLLGHRFGWVPEGIAQTLIEQEPWLDKHAGSSVTELEILHGVLKDPGKARGSFFYFRSRRFIEALTPERRPFFEEAPNALEVERLGRMEAERLSAERRNKLESLKQSIRESGVPVREDYLDAAALGEMVYADLANLIDALYPPGDEIDPLDREAAEHHAFAADKARIYVGGSAYLARLDAHAARQTEANSDCGLVIAGKSGIGKSALLAAWVLRHAADRTKPEVAPKRLWKRLTDMFRSPREPSQDAPLVLAHFIGATAASTDTDAMLRRLIGELNRQLDLRHDIPENSDALRAAFANCLHMAATKRGVVLVVDALDQLDRADHVALSWLPERLPNNLVMIVSALDGSALDELGRRGWSRLELEPLRAQDRGQLISEFLARYRKALGPDRSRHIEQAEQTGNPLFLRSMLEELRLHGEHRTLDDCINRYLGAHSLDDLFERILERYERDFDWERPHLVRDAMVLLWSARRGLSENELLALLGENGERLPQAMWSPLYLAAAAFFVNRSGQIGFSHDYMRFAVQRRFLPTEAAQTEAHLRLANYFSEQEQGPRMLEELPWQLARAGAWQALRDRLVDLEFFTRAWDHDRFDVKRHWAELEKNSEHRIAAAYDAITRNPVAHVEHFGLGLANLATLHFDTGEVEIGWAIGDFLWRYYQSAAVPKDTAGRLAVEVMHKIFGGKALGAETPPLQRDDSAETLRVGDVVQAMLGVINGEIGSVRTLQGQVSLLIALGLLDDATILLEELERIYVARRDEVGRGNCLVNRAIILNKRGSLDEALAYLQEGERIGRGFGDKLLVQDALGHQAHLMNRRREHERALELFKAQEAICRELGLLERLVDCMSNQAMLFRDRGEPDLAFRILLEAERRAREWGSKRKLMAALGNQGLVLADRREFDAAMTRFDEVAEMARTLRDPFALHTTLGNQAFILAERGDLERALQLAEDKKKLCRELGDKRGLADALGKVAVIHAKRGEFETGLACAEEAAAICKELGDSRGLVQQLLAQSACWEGLRRPEDELRCIEESFYQALAMGLPDLVRQIEPMREKVRSKILSEQSITNYRLAVLVNPDDPEAHNDLAIALFHGGDIDGAILELKEVIRLMPTSAMGYFGLGTIYDKGGDQHAALEQFRIAHQIDPSPMTLEAVRTLEHAVGSAPEAQFARPSSS